MRRFIGILGVVLFTNTIHINGQPIEWRVKAQAAVDAAIPLAEKDPTRPLYHFRPPAQWMNDICGAIYYGGYYHAFYQYNPFSGDAWGEDYTLWAHARSKDLVHWEDLPWSLLPMKEQGERRCNSGSISLDENGRPIILYTFVPEDNTATRYGKREHWAAIPLDDELIKWKRVKNEPLMAAGMNGVPETVKSTWSDPFVFRSDGRTFVTFKSCNGLVCEAKDKELTNWEYAGQMDGVIGECPNFFPMDDKWVLIRSTMPISYVVGDFDSKKFHSKKMVERDLWTMVLVKTLQRIDHGLAGYMPPMYLLMMMGVVLCLVGFVGLSQIEAGTAACHYLGF